MAATGRRREAGEENAADNRAVSLSDDAVGVRILELEVHHPDRELHGRLLWREVVRGGNCLMGVERYLSARLLRPRTALVASLRVRHSSTVPTETCSWLDVAAGIELSLDSLPAAYVAETRPVVSTKAQERPICLIGKSQCSSRASAASRVAGFKPELGQYMSNVVFRRLLGDD